MNFSSEVAAAAVWLFTWSINNVSCCKVEEELAPCRHHSVRSEEAYQMPKSLSGEFATLVLAPKMMTLCL